MKPKSLSSKQICFGLLGLGSAILIFWLIIGYAKGLNTPVPPAHPLLHEGGRLVIPETSPLRQFIVVEPVTEQLVISPFTLPAIVEADPATLVKVLPPLSGRIVSLNKRLGDPVKAGEILFTIDSADLAQALSDLERAKAALTFSQENLKRQQRLSVSNIAARRDLQQARNDYDQALSELQRANARLQALNVKTTDVNEHLLVVRSPLTGRVVDLNAAIGGYWNDVTAPIMTVADLSNVFVTASAQEKDLKHLYVGQDVDVVLDAYPQHLRSKIQFIGALMNPDTRTVGVRMMFENSTGQLKPNMFGKAIFLSQPHKRVILPLTTVIQRGFDSIVFVEVKPWQFEPRLLELGPQINDKVEVISGLHSGERVVVKGGIILND
ncbi:Cation efflux system protein CzcB [Legionella massiliensis]|uniref:Cation efflux system protein CzcB n=1 Tax=Legionella massiliensis TaxID=1034943 RepID=A0A078L0C0_9GAMM|nr:efflux RND transporter periplasmic adaptor subunit [Legionella massiliensis]CDZ77489.1 Cation efflux system protein CzcB [Legionella massiliensis]CEE13227.1 Cobalt-zinc-cadmium resistance protein CzcB [Legionella massiliensis]